MMAIIKALAKPAYLVIWVLSAFVVCVVMILFLAVLMDHIGLWVIPLAAVEAAFSMYFMSLMGKLFEKLFENAPNKNLEVAAALGRQMSYHKFGEVIPWGSRK